MRLPSFRTIAISALVAGVAIATPAYAKNPMVGGAPMYATKNIVENAVNSKDHTTLVAAVKAAGLVDTLQGAGPFTVFAPTNEAFAALPAGTVDTLLKPENKDKLAKVLTYHVVAGKASAPTIDEEGQGDGGKHEIKTVSGGTLTARSRTARLYSPTRTAASPKVTIADVNQSNGVIHVIDKVLLPK